MIEANRYKLGIFIIIGVILVLGGIFVFGISQFFVDKIKVMTIFDDSVDGLSVGSSVKFNGVPIGTVKRIMINENEDINVYMEIFTNVMSDNVKERILNHSEGSLKKVAEDFRDAGLRSSLQLQGITGEKFVSFQYYKDLKDKNETDIKDIDIPDDVFFIPSVRTYLSSAPDNISKALKNLSEVDFDGLANNFENTILSINQLTHKLDSLTNSIQDQELTRSLAHTLKQVDAMAAAVSELCQDLDNEPSSVIWGVQRKEIFPKKK
ncbi:MAG TPA: MlaD family protein [Victivallales bacterium]|nr:MlaD family protein [Victivallales bacterium]